MRRPFMSSLMILALMAAVAVGGARSLAQTPADRATVEDVRRKLMRLPYYGVFDFLAFSYDKGTVTLSGFAYQAALKADAERAVKQVARVDDVINKIEELPVSATDDELRWKTYYAIYTDPFLSRYAPAGGMPWGHQHRVPLGRFGSAARFPGVEPVGNYPIVIGSRACARAADRETTGYHSCGSGAHQGSSGHEPGQRLGEQRADRREDDRAVERPRRGLVRESRQFGSVVAGECQRLMIPRLGKGVDFAAVMPRDLADDVVAAPNP
jgi:hypothetical protein